MTVQNACQLLIDWANQQQHWVRAIVREVFATRQPVLSVAVEEFYQRCLVERDLREGTVSQVPQLSIDDDRDETTEKLVLKVIRDVENVNRLAPDPKNRIQSARNGSLW